VRIALMIEGQEDVTWEDWVALADACERHGFEALFRSDHYLSVDDFRERGALDAWGTVNALAARTSTLRLGTLVSPATFRHPSVLAKLAVTADHVSGGRVELGIGTGWWESEHTAYGFPFGAMGTRMDVLAEQLEIIHRQWGEEPFSFHGAHYAIENLDARPKPVQRPHPPLIMGGAAGRRSAALAARWADEYNTVFPDVATAKDRHDKVMAACEEAGRDPATMGFSMMNGLLIGADEPELHDRAQALAEWRREPTDLEALRGSWVAGTTEQVIERLREYEAAGVQRVMLQHLLHRDLDVIELVGGEVIPAVA
jgi:F420-dependent oxidoreductase-like protein